MLRIVHRDRSCPREWKVTVFHHSKQTMTLAKQPRILSECPWTSLRTASLTASHSEYERQLNALNANAYHFSLKSDSAKMMKLYLAVAIFLEPIIYVFRTWTKRCSNTFFSAQKQRNSPDVHFPKAATINVQLISEIFIIYLINCNFIYLFHTQMFYIRRDI